VIVLVDDLGWSDVGAYGSEIATPNLDRLAETGLAFRHFYNTAKCFPSRACLLTGVYAQQNGMSETHATLRNAVTLGEVLGAAGYRTYASGKHHGDDNLFDRGFDHYYGLRDGACNHFNPGLPREGEPPPARKGRPRIWADDALEFDTRDPGRQDYFPEGFYSTDAFTDRALACLDEHAQKHADDPFLLYLAYTAPHDPLMAPAAGIDRYAGVYEAGYDKIRNARYERQVASGLIDPETNPLPPGSHADWDRLAPGERAQEVRRMQVYAAMIDRVDQQVGRVLAKLDEMGARENTVVLFLSDNGASAEAVQFGDLTAPIGGVDRYDSLREDWANVANTPLRRFKNDSYEGGVRTPLIVNWPAGVANPGRRVDHPGHMVDVMALLIDLADAQYPSSWQGQPVAPLQGQSFAPVLFDDLQPGRAPMYFEWGDGRALIHWPYKVVRQGDEPWRLYNLAIDGTETNDLSAQMPELRAQMIKVHASFFTGRSLKEEGR